MAACEGHSKIFPQYKNSAKPRQLASSKCEPSSTHARAAPRKEEILPFSHPSAPQNLYFSGSSLSIFSASLRSSSNAFAKTKKLSRSLTCPRNSMLLTVFIPCMASLLQKILASRYEKLAPHYKYSSAPARNKAA